jgi:hyperosmotically inducible periplasmic protein
MKKSVLALFAGALLMSFGAFAKDNNDKHMDPYLPGPDNEARMVKDIRHALIQLPWYGVFDDLGFNVNGGTVVLQGEVVNPVTKTDAEKAVKRVEGVTNVVNNIEVLPVSPMDDQSRRAVYRAIYGDSAIGTRYGFQALPSIHIIVKNGQLRLEGVVANEFDRNLIGNRANGVPGIFSVQNDLQVEAKK